MAKTTINYYLDFDFNRIKKAYERALNQAKKSVQLDEKMTKEVKRDLEFIAWSAVSDWYDKFDPNIYRREEDLFNAYKIVVTDDRWDIDYHWKYMQKQHRASNAYIFGNSFLGGYHGGARKGEFHPDPGVAYWRTPGFTSWGEPAQRDEAPYFIIEREKNKYLKKKIREYDKKVIDPLEALIDDLAFELESATELLEAREKWQKDRGAI